MLDKHCLKLRCEKGFTIFEALFSLGIITGLFLLVLTLYIALVDKSDYVNVDHEIVISEQELENWIKKDYRENLVKSVEITNSNKRLTFKIKDDSEQGWYTIQYANKEDKGFFRTVNSDSKVETLEMLPYKVTEIKRLEDSKILSITYNYPDSSTSSSPAKSNKKILVQLH